MALSYRQVKDLYDRLASSGATTVSLPEWSERMNALTGTDLYTSGQNDNVIKRASVGIDRALESVPGLVESSRELGRSAGSLVGNPQAGAEIGATLPRMTVNSLPYLIPGPGWMAGGARLGGAALLSGADAYTQTGSPAAGVVSGAMAAVLPKATDVVEQAVLKRIGGKLVQGPIASEVVTEPGGQISRLVTDQLKRYYPQSFGQAATANIGGQVGAAGVMEVQRWGEELFSGRPLHSPFTTENLLNLTLGNAPFAAIHLGGRAVGLPSAQQQARQAQEAIAKTESLMELKRAQDALAERSDIEKVPLVEQPSLTPELQQELSSRLGSLRQQQEAITSKASITPEDAERLNGLIAEDSALRQNVSSTSVLGAEQSPEHIPLVGTLLHETPKWRKIYVADDEANPPEFRGQVIEYSKGLREPSPVPVPGTELLGFGVTADPLWRTTKTLAEEQERQARYAIRRPAEPSSATADLPVQANYAADPLEHVTSLDRIEADVDIARTPAQLQKAIVRLRQLEETVGLSEFNDKQLSRIVAKLAAKGEKGDLAKKAVKARASRARRLLETQAARQEEVASAEGWLSEQEALGEQGPQALLNEFRNYSKALAGKGGRRATLVESGELTRMFYKLRDDPDAMERLASQVDEVVGSGKGLGKVRPVSEEIHEVIKDNEDSGPVRNIVAESALRSLQNAQARQAFEAWPRKNETNWDYEKRTFVDWVEEFGPPSKEDVNDAAEFFADRDGLAIPEVKDELTDFLERPHVKIWQETLENTLKDAKAHAPQPQRIEPIEAGDNFIWGLTSFDPMRNVLGGKHTLPKTGVLFAEQFRNLAGRGKPLSKVEFELLQQIVPEAFSEGKVNVPELFKQLKEKGPVVEVKKLGEGAASVGRQLRDRFIHEAETAGYTVEEGMPGEGQQIYDKDGEIVEYKDLPLHLKTLANEIAATHDEDGNAEGGSRYSFLGPKSEQEMPGYVEGLVRVPLKKTFTQEGDFGDPVETTKAQYSGPHFGSEDTNVLAFFRGYEETLPDGRKAFHVIEVQSDWGQQARNKPITDVGVGINTHPLLSVYETLALKSAIDHARSVGADSIILSDAETAMMTEGHDKLVTRNEMTDEERKNWQPPQAGGMRLHYDTTLPSALKKLTGDEGQRVEVGTHKSTINMDDEGVLNPATGEYEAPPRKGSPVFRDPSGAPKFSISGRLYDLTKAFGNRDEQGGFTLGDPARAPQIPTPRVYASDIAAEQEVISKLTTDGAGLIHELSTSSDPQVVAIASDLAKNFPEALLRIDSGVYEVPGAYAARRPANRVGIFLDRSLPTMSKFTRDNVILHELIHGLTLHELNNPRVKPETVAELTQLRQRLIEALPKKLRELYDAAIANDWYRRFANGDLGMSDLGTNARDSQILYALLNNDELVAQGFSSRSVREFMQSVGGKQKSAWKSFTGWVKNLLGLGEKVDSTAFGDFLSTTSQLMSHGEWLADFANFGERHLESLGKGGSYGRAQTQRALGIVADSAFGTDEPLTIATSLDFSQSKGTSNTELRRARRAYESLLKDSPDDLMHVSNVLSELGHRNIDELVTSAIGERQNISEALDLLPPEATSYVFEKLRDSKDVLDVVMAATNAKNSLMTNVANPKLARDSVAPVLKEINNLLAHEQFQTKMATDLAGLSAVSPEGFMDALPTMAPKVFEDFVEGTQDVGGKGLSWFAKTLEPMGQLARRVPEAAEAISKGFQLSANTRKMFHEAVKWLGMDTSSPYVDVLTKESVHATEKVLANPVLLDKVNRWMHLNNDKGKDSVQMLADNDADVAKLLSGLSDEQKGLVRDVVAKAGKVTQMMNAQKLEKMTEIAAVNGAAVAGVKSGLKTKDNVALSDTLLRAVIDSADPLKQMDAQVRIQNVQQRMTPEAFIELFDFTKGEAEKIKLWKEYYDANPFWATAQRTERFIVDYLKNGKKFKGQASTMKEARDLIAKKGGTEIAITDQFAGREDEPFAFPNMSPEMAQRMQEIEANQYGMLAKVLSPDDLLEVQRTSPVTQILREANAQQSIPQVQAPPRLLSQGAEELPWMWNHLAWAQREANYWSRQLLRAQARTYLKDVELRDNKELRDKLKTNFDNLLMPDPQIAQKMTRFASTWFLGFNLATAMVNMAQPFTTHVAELTSLSGRPVDSYRRVLNAMKEIGGHFVGKKEWASPEHEKLMNEAVKDGEIGVGMYDDDAAAQESIAINYKRAMRKNKPQTLGERLGTLAGAYATAGMFVFKQGEQINSRSALLASFDYYREQGLSYSDAKAKAYEFNHATNFGGGRAQRPVGLYSSRSPFLRGAAMLGTSLQSYVLGTTAQIARYLQKGSFRPDGLSPSQVYAARKAAIQMLATQFLAAGALGMPFVSSALALLDKEFPELELNRKTREGVNSFLSGDEENGSVLTDIAMTGVPSMLGWDMQSRLSMGNTLPGVSEVNGFQPENLIGAPGNIVRNFVNGATGWVKGDKKAGTNFFPPPVKKLVESGAAFLQGDANIRDYQGRPLANPTRGERVGQLLGFQPKRLSEQNAAARILKQSEEVLRTQTTRFHQQQAEEVLKGNFGTVRQELRARKQANNKYDDVAAVQAIARVAEELTFPRDLRREGTQRGAARRSVLLGTYGEVVGGQASEVDRLKFRKMIEGRLGLQGDARRELQLAALMDQLRLQNPGATRLELKAAALEATSRVSRQRQLSPLEFQ